MCIVAVAHRVSERYPLIVAANRDERHSRPTESAHWWGDPGSLLAGRDLEAGGTWLGITRAGRFAAVTNIFEAGAVRAARSRGDLVTRFLEGSECAAGYAAAVEASGSLYGPFNLVLFDGARLHFASNRFESSGLQAGTHVFSNSAPGLLWPKVGSLAGAIQSALDSDDLAEQLIELLSKPEVRGPLERAPESLFVVGNAFGTRCSTALTIDAHGRVVFIEQGFDAAGRPTGRSEQAFVV